MRLLIRVSRSYEETHPKTKTGHATFLRIAVTLTMQLHIALRSRPAFRRSPTGAHRAVEGADIPLYVCSGNFLVWPTVYVPLRSPLKTEIIRLEDFRERA